MAQLVIAAAGAAIGGAIPGFGIAALGLSGQALGWTIGSLIGSAFTPGQKSSGPRLSDLSVSSSAYGTPIPYTQGGPRLAGQIVWASTKREIATTTRQGKGGGKNKTTTYAYELDLLILLTDNEIDGISRVWRDGKLIWNKSPSATNADITQSDAVADWTRITAYTGGAAQLPDPTYEAAVGAANAPAYRGRGAVFIEALQLGQSGALPNLTFEIGAAGYLGDHAPGDGLTRFQTAFAGGSSADISAFANGSGTIGLPGGFSFVGNGYYEATISGPYDRSLKYGTNTNLGRQPNTAFTMEAFFTTEELYTTAGVCSILGGTYISSAGGGGNTSIYCGTDTGRVTVDSQLDGGYSNTGTTDVVGDPSQHHYALCIDVAGTFNIYLNGVRKLGPLSTNNLGHTNGNFTLGGPGVGGGAYVLRVQGVRIRRAVMYSGASFTPPTSPDDWGAP
jgi:hypothetical protein